MRCSAIAQLLAVLSAVMLPASVTAQIEAEPRIALHISPHNAKANCSAETGAPTNLPCADFVTAGGSSSGYDVYIVTVRNDSGGIAGAVFGLDYDPVAGRGIDVFGWTRCADLEFPTAGWPNAGAGTVITWSRTDNCQLDVVQGRVQAVAGFLYVYAYGADELRITERLSVSQPSIELADCELSAFPVPATMRGRVALGQPEVNAGWNPCLDEATCDVGVSLLDFGSLPLGTSTERTFSVTNPGDEIFTIAPVAVGVGYTVIAGGEDRAVAPGQTVTVAVQFTPVAEVDHVGYIDLQGGGCAPVSCFGRAQSACSMEEDYPGFGYVPINRSVVRGVKITAEGEGIVSGVVSFDGPEYSISPEDSMVHLLPGETQLLPVRFTPRGLGYRLGSLTIPGTSCGRLQLAGFGIAPDSSCFMEPDFLDFGEVPVDESGILLLKIVAPGTKVVYGSIRFDVPGFSVPPEDASVYAAPGDTLFLPVRFTPTHPGLFTGNLTISGTACGSVLIAGTGITPDPRCDLEPGILDFGEVVVGDVGTDFVEIVAGDTEVVSGTVLVDTPEFSVPSGEEFVHVLPGNTLLLPVRFNPSAPGPVLGNLTIQGTVCRSAVLLGQGVLTESDCDVDPQVLQFGTIGVNAPTTQTVEITSTGTEAIAGNVMFDTPDYSVSPGDSPIHVPPGGTLSLPVQFAPRSPGFKVDRLTIEGMQCGSVLLNGTGFADCGVHPSELAYGDVPLGTWRDLSLRITNQGTLRFQGSVISECAEFTVVTGGGAYDLDTGEFRDVIVRFRPSQPGPRSCSLDVGSGCDPFSLTGNGTAAATCGVQPVELAYGEVPLGSWQDLSLRITNQGNLRLQGSVVSGCTEFTVVAGGGAYDLAPGEIRDVMVRFSPTQLGPRSCSLDLGSGCGPFPLTGSGSTGFTECEVQPAELAYGDVPLGGWRDLSLRIANQGNLRLQGSVVSACSEFTVVTGAGAYDLAPGETRDVMVRFSPTQAGPRSCSLDLGSECGPFPLTGSGTDSSDCGVQPAELAYGEVSLGSWRDLSLRITNQGSSQLQGTVVNDCPEFTLTTGGGAYDLAPGEFRDVMVRFSPTQPGPRSCSLDLGSGCRSFLLTGSGTGFTDCAVQPAELSYGSVPLGSWQDLSLRITNQGNLRLQGSVVSGCTEFTVVAGGGAYDLAPGEFRDVLVRFRPTQAGPRGCSLDLGSECGPLPLTGSGTDFAGCGADETSLEFRDVTVGQFRELTFTIRNLTEAVLSGTITSSGDPFQVMAGGGDYSLLPGESREVTVRFAPTVGGLQTASITYSPDCPAIECLGAGLTSGNYTQLNAKIALHVQPSAVKNVCMAGPTFTPCDDFATEGPLLGPYHVYLVVAEATAGYGIGGLQFGLEIGAEPVARDAVIEWSLCADWEMPGEDWPLSGSQNLIRWNAEVNCQQEYRPELGFEGAQAIAGHFYVYAYGDVYLHITHPSVGVSAKVEDCAGRVTPLGQNDLGLVRFGSGVGFNPCDEGYGLPVELLSFTVTPTEAGAEVTWEIAGEVSDVAGFRIHREIGGGERVAVHDQLLWGDLSYTVLDPEGRATGTRYWLAEYQRDGRVSWHGPAVLEGTATSRLMLAQNHPNPFSSGTRIGFRVEEEGPVSLRVFDLAGREVARLADGVLESGFHELEWDGLDGAGQRVRAGIYLYRLETQTHRLTRKLLVLR